MAQQPQSSGSPSIAFRNSYLPRSGSMTAGEEYELTSPPSARSRELPSSRSTVDLTDATGRSPTTEQQQQPRRTRGLSIHQLARQPTSLLFEHFHSPDAARRALPSNFLHEDDEPGRDARRSRQADDGEHHDARRPDNAILHGLGMDDDPYDVARGMQSAWKRKVFLTMEEPTSGEEALMIHWGVTALIVFSAFLTILSTLPGVHMNPTSTRVIFGLDTTVVVLFSVEYILRIIGHSDSWPQFYGWVFSFFGITDLLSILPYYIELLLQADTSVLFRFSILRTFRLLRVFRAFRYSNTVILTIEVMRISIKLSQDALIALGYFILMVVVIFSTLLYFAERGAWDPVLQAFVDADGDPTDFASIPAASWFVLVTMATVGYGDITPRSTLGRLCTVPLLAFGLLLIALPSFVLGRNFSLVWDHLRNASSADGNSNAIYAAADSPTPRHSRDGRTSGDDCADDARGGRAASGRTSMDTTPLPTTTNGYASVAGGQSTGLATLPMGSPEHRSSSVNSASRRRMGGRPGLGPATVASPDLSNLKLARNQEALSAQIDGLREVVESQGRLIGRLLEALEQRPREGVI